jgi:deoxyribonuclease IV
VRIGAQVRGGGELVGALDRARAIGAEAVQVFTQSSRAWKPTQYAPAVLERYRAAAASDDAISATYCHATYLINLASRDPVLLERSRDTLVTNLTVALGMGASGLVLHVGSHRGVGFDGTLHQVVDSIHYALEAAWDPVGSAGGDVAGGDPTSAGCPILLENSAGAGDTVGSSFEELGAILEASAAGEALGVCLDTQHLWASGLGFGSPAEADELVLSFDKTIGLSKLGCLHLNDSKVPFGARRDRHANVGDGAIGEKALGCLLAHPALRDQVAIMEVPGDGHGPRLQDIRAARRALRSGRRQWAAERERWDGEVVQRRAGAERIGSLAGQGQIGQGQN